MCIYQECISGDCDSFKYEVCSENPVYASVTAGRHICHAILFVDTETGSYMADRNCYDDPHSLCTEECEPKLHPAFPYINNTALYDCCCIGNLCNYVILNYTGIIITIPVLTGAKMINSFTVQIAK